MLFDVRFLPNPHWVDELRPFNGLDQPVRDYVLGQDATGAFLDRLGALLEVMVPAFVSEGKHYLTIGVGCTGGKHRSVVLTEEIAQRIRDLGVAVRTDHRDPRHPGHSFPRSRRSAAGTGSPGRWARCAC